MVPALTAAMAQPIDALLVKADPVVYPAALETVLGTADFVARILDGAAVASLPFQRPRRIIFTLNLGAARRAAIEVPAALVALADEVIE
jgi:putative ABC transport system substrate-binding protein